MGRLYCAHVSSTKVQVLTSQLYLNKSLDKSAYTSNQLQMRVFATALTYPSPQLV